MRILAASVALLAITGCAETSPNVMQSSSASIGFSQTFDREETSRLAEAHCTKYGKTARLTDVHDFFMTFDCVAP